MRIERHITSWFLYLFSAVLTAFAIGTEVSSANEAIEPRAISTWSAVFTLTNESSANELAVFHPDGQGGLMAPVMYPTGGKGSGGGLGNQGALALGWDAQYLYAVNPGSNTITVFHLSNSGVVPAQIVSSGGVNPISVTVHGNILYVLNAGGIASGGMDTIAGFTIKANGTLTALKNSTRHLSAPNTGAAQIGFDATGKILAVTEKATNLITIFQLDRHSVPAKQMTVHSSGTTPFGFAFTNNDLLIVSEAFAGNTIASAASSYWVDPYGLHVHTDSASIPTHQAAACWVAITHDNRFAYTANTGSRTITGFTIGGNGKLTPLLSTGLSATTGRTPTDLAVYGNSTLFVLNSGDGSVETFTIGHDGSLNSHHVASGLPLTHPTGLVVR